MVTLDNMKHQIAVLNSPNPTAITRIVILTRKHVRFERINQVRISKANLRSTDSRYSAKRTGHRTTSDFELEGAPRLRCPYFSNHCSSAFCACIRLPAC
jgi:hypothetical protein